MTHSKHMRLAIVVCLAILTTSGCSDPRETVIPPNVDNWESDAQLKSAIEKLTDEEKKLVVAYVVRAKMGEVFGGDGIKEGLTIAEAISIQKQWQIEKQEEEKRRELLAAELEEKLLAALREMNQALTVTLLSLEYREKNYEANIYSDYFAIRIGFKNNTANDIAGAKGVVVLSDIFGDTIKRIRLSNDDGIKANSNSIWMGTMDYNQFQAVDNKLKTTDFDKLKFDWEPEVYIFSDGTRLTMPES